jgi:hypothetical protein
MNNQIKMNFIFKIVLIFVCTLVSTLVLARDAGGLSDPLPNRFYTLIDGQCRSGGIELSKGQLSGYNSLTSKAETIGRIEADRLVLNQAFEILVDKTRIKAKIVQLTLPQTASLMSGRPASEYPGLLVKPPVNAHMLIELSTGKTCLSDGNQPIFNTQFGTQAVCPMAIMMVSESQCINVRKSLRAARTQNQATSTLAIKEVGQLNEFVDE